jgi:hypothetical protein
MKTSEIRDKLSGYVDSISQKDGVVTIRRGFFYTNGMTSEKLAKTVKSVFPFAEILEHNTIWRPFRGGASVAQGSHFYVKFRLPEETAKLSNAAEKLRSDLQENYESWIASTDVLDTDEGVMQTASSVLSRMYEELMEASSEARIRREAMLSRLAS